MKHLKSLYVFRENYVIISVNISFE